jgi:hypothetical protein
MTDNAKEQVQKTWPDVSDKALELLQTGLGNVADLVGDITSKFAEAAPQVWYGLVEYHRWKSIGELSTTILFFITSIVLIYSGIKIYLSTIPDRKTEGYWSDITMTHFWISLIMFFVGCITLIIQINSFPKEIANVVVPERKAAIEIITVIKNGGKLDEDLCSSNVK